MLHKPLFLSEKESILKELCQRFDSVKDWLSARGLLMIYSLHLALGDAC